MNFRVLRSNLKSPRQFLSPPIEKNIGFYEPRFLRTSGFTNTFSGPLECLFIIITSVFMNFFWKHAFIKKVENQISVIIDKVIIKINKSLDKVQI